MSGHIVPKKTYYTIFGLLMLLLVATVAIAYLDLGSPANITIALGIAVIKAALVVLYFMHLKYSYKLIWVVALGGFLWLALLIFGVYVDYFTRMWIPVRGAL